MSESSQAQRYTFNGYSHIYPQEAHYFCISIAVPSKPSWYAMLVRLQPSFTCITMTVSMAGTKWAKSSQRSKLVGGKSVSERPKGPAMKRRIRCPRRLDECVPETGAPPATGRSRCYPSIRQQDYARYTQRQGCPAHRPQAGRVTVDTWVRPEAYLPQVLGSPA